MAVEAVSRRAADAPRLIDIDTLPDIMALDDTYASLSASLREIGLSTPERAVDTSDGHLDLLRWQFLRLLGPRRRELGTQSSEMHELLDSKVMLQTLLTSGECGPQEANDMPHRDLDNAVIQERWRNAIALLCQLMAADDEDVVGSWCGESELVWAREKVLAELCSRSAIGTCVHKIVRYRTQDEAGKSVFGGAMYEGRPVTLAEMAKTGGVCGAISKFASGACQAFGVPAMPVTQPGHCAYIWLDESGRWALGNNCSGWALSGRHAPVQVSWGEKAWEVPLMHRAQNQPERYARSERMRSLAHLLEQAGTGTHAHIELAVSACEACPHNHAAWLDVLGLLTRARAAGLGTDDAPWVARCWEEARLQDELALEQIVSASKPVSVSDCPERAKNVVDGSGSEWWTGETSAWLEIDLGQPCRVSAVTLQWWGYSVAASFKVLARSGAEELWVEQRTQADATGPSQKANGWTEILGWDSPCSHVRLELADGKLDPWGKNKLFGIRQLLVKGQAVSSFADRLPCTAESVLKATVSRLLVVDDMLDVSIVTSVVADICSAADSIVFEAAPCISRFKPVVVSDCAARASNVVDGTGSEWWTENETAWLELDLQDCFCVVAVQIQWWGVSAASQFKVLSSVDGRPFEEQRTQADAKGPSNKMNGWTHIRGWSAPTSRLRFELAEGKRDPWGKNRFFGIRQLIVKGYPHRTS